MGRECRKERSWVKGEAGSGRKRTNWVRKEALMNLGQLRGLSVEHEGF